MAVVHGTSGHDVLEGTPGADSLYGYGGDDYIYGSAGADLLDGGEGYDWLTYQDSDAAVSVNLATGAVSGGHAEGDTISGFEELSGSVHDDTLIGDDGYNWISGGAGADVLEGRGGFDYVAYTTSDAAVSVNLATGAVSGGHAEGDTISGFEVAWGSHHDDTLIGDDGANRLRGRDGADRLEGGAGNDTLEGGAGADLLDGGEGRDILSYWNSEEGVAVDLSTGSASGGDTLRGFEYVWGSPNADTITGDAGDNYINAGTARISSTAGPVPIPCRTIPPARVSR